MGDTVWTVEEGFNPAVHGFAGMQMRLDRGKGRGHGRGKGHNRGKGRGQAQGKGKV
jgi:hypothetical protein